MADGWWNLDGAITSCVAAYQPIGAADLASSKVNLFNPGTYDAYAGTNPDWDVTNGWEFTAASSQYLKTGVTPNSLNWSVLVRFSNAPVGDQWLFGYYTTRGFGIIPYKATNVREYYNGGVKSVSGGKTSGVIGIAKNQAYLDGSADGTTWTQLAHTAAEMFIGDINLTGQHRYYGGYIQAIAFYNDTLTSTQVGLLTTAMNLLPDVAATTGHPAVNRMSMVKFAHGYKGV